MDTVSIGEFIARERKAKKLTQVQLADRLGISNKTVSKWECGLGLPEVSLLMPLCEQLGISVNELLSAKRLNDADYRKNAEENIMKIMNEREENRKKYIITTVAGLIATVAFITILAFISMYGEYMSTPAKVLFSVISWLIFAAGLAIAVYGELRAGYYKCGKCGKKFVPSLWEYMAGPHIGSTRRLKCKHCNEKSWCKKVMSSDE